MRQSGTSLIEILITVVLLAFGLLGIAALQSKAQVGSIEAYQRAQAIVLLEDMQARMEANAEMADDYLTANPLGTGTAVANCNALPPGATRDTCEWSWALSGAAEVKDGNKLGAMTGARGCIEEVQAPDPTPGVCRHGIYLITVAWQGLHPTVAPAQACARNAYGPDSHRRAISVRVGIGQPTCK
jgi:type IV pilus assembly protein PilV